jgi:hypothetical protein
MFYSVINIVIEGAKFIIYPLFDYHICINIKTLILFNFF